MKLIALMTVMLLSSCSFSEKHPELLDEVKKIEKEAIDDIATDLKDQVDKQKVKDAKVSAPIITVPVK
jgi:glutaredoxin